MAVARLDRPLAEAKGRIAALERELESTRDQLRLAEASAHEWWAKADAAIRRAAWMRSTWSWRLTGPFRAISRLARSVDKRLAKLGMAAEPPGGYRGAKRLFSRLARSFSKRYRRLRDLPAVHAPPPAPPRIATHDALSADGRLVLQRLLASRRVDGGSGTGR